MIKKKAPGNSWKDQIMFFFSVNENLSAEMPSSVVNYVLIIQLKCI